MTRPEATAPKTVLIVEDNTLNMKLFNDLLQASGHVTVTCTDGRRVLDLIRSGRPDLVVMDIQLPEVSGLEVTRQLKADPEFKDIPVIAVTAFAMKGDEAKIRECGCDGYISKPVAAADFIKTINQFLL